MDICGETISGETRVLQVYSRYLWLGVVGPLAQVGQNFVPGSAGLMPKSCHPISQTPFTNKAKFFGILTFGKK